MENIKRERQRILNKELREYEATVSMNDEEREALHEWVADGNSVYENPSLAVDDWGRPLEFLADLRWQSEIFQDLEQLDERGRENYLGRLCGIDTIDNLKEDMDALFLQVNIYTRVLQRYGLLDIAEKELEEIKARARTEAYPDCDNLDELPFPE